MERVRSWRQTTNDFFTDNIVMNICRTILLGLLLAASNAAIGSGVSYELALLLKSIQTMSANFTQQLLDLDGSEVESFQGTFELAKPGKMRWHVKQPMEQQLVSDGNILWIYDPDLEQVVIENFTDKIKSTPIALFNGEVADLDQRYITTMESVSSDTELFTLTPKDPESLFSRIDIVFDASMPKSIGVTDTFDQRTLITFEELKVNLLLDSSVFSFTIPAQVDVINNVQ